MLSDRPVLGVGLELPVLGHSPPSWTVEGLSPPQNSGGSGCVRVPSPLIGSYSVGSHLLLPRSPPLHLLPLQSKNPGRHCWLLEKTEVLDLRDMMKKATECRIAAGHRGPPPPHPYPDLEPTDHQVLLRCKFEYKDTIENDATQIIPAYTCQCVKMNGDGPAI